MTDDTDARIIRAEVAAHASAAGLVEADAARLLDLSAVTLDSAGNVVIPPGWLDAQRAAKPYLFRVAGTSTSNPAAPPAPGQMRAKKAAEMTPAERQAFYRAQGINTRTR